MTARGAAPRYPDWLVQAYAQLREPLARPTHLPRAPLRLHLIAAGVQDRLHPLHHSTHTRRIVNLWRTHADAIRLQPIWR